MKGLITAVFVLTTVAALTVLPANTAEAESPWTGIVTASGLSVRLGPNTQNAPVGKLKYGDAVTVLEEVQGEPVLGQSTWYRIGEKEFVYGAFVARGNLEEIDHGDGERWIDVDLTKKIARAMVDETPIYTAEVTIGRVGWNTPTGRFSIIGRVESETMDSATIGIPRDSQDGYYLTGVLYTQYFLPTGQAIHYNYWVPDESFGSAASSRGCIGMRLNDARFFWDFAETGTAVFIHY